MGEYIKSVYSRMNKWVFWICLSISVFLIITSFFIPPAGVVDSSVVACVGELFLWPVLAVVMSAVDKGSDIKLTKGDTTVHIDNPDKKENND